MIDGTMLIDKPAGMTSFGVVARIRRVLSQKADKKVKVGHTGTLDPFATGLMIIVVGKECQQAGKYSKLDKVYEATVTLGKTSTTGDPEGDIVGTSNVVPTLDKIKTVMGQFRGQITQKPSIYSAIKVNGERAYKLARAGKKPDMPERQVTIHSLEIVEYKYPELKIRAHVSSGTYIRTLAIDIGEALGTGAYCSGLRRTKISDWTVNEAQQLSDFGIND